MWQLSHQTKHVLSSPAPAADSEATPATIIEDVRRAIERKQPGDASLESSARQAEPVCMLCVGGVFLREKYQPSARPLPFLSFPRESHPPSRPPPPPPPHPTYINRLGPRGILPAQSHSHPRHDSIPRSKSIHPSAAGRHTHTGFALAGMDAFYSTTASSTSSAPYGGYGGGGEGWGYDSMKNFRQISPAVQTHLKLVIYAPPPPVYSFLAVENCECHRLDWNGCMIRRKDTIRLE
jgi:hypothetical protein